MASNQYQYLINGPNSGQTAVSGAAYANSTTLTDVGPLPDFTIPAGTLALGQVWRVTAAGQFSTTGTPTLLLGLYYGGVAGTALATSGALTTASGVTALTWRFEIMLECRAVGSAGTLLAIGEAVGITSATAKNLVPASSPAVVTVNTTTANALVVGAQWGTASASNTLTCHHLFVEQLN